MISETVLELSRWQFALTAMCHFLFIPLSLGLSLLLAMMETCYVVTGQPLYKNRVQFWSRIFAINFVLAVITRLGLLWQFGSNGSYFSHYVGDVFALPLALEALTSFFTAAVLFGPFYLGWDRLGKFSHLLVSWLISLSVTVSAYWVLLANGWMQNPVAARFNYQSYRMELTDFALLINNPVAISKFVHTLTAAYVAAMAVVMAISAYRLLKQPDNVEDSHSFKWASGLGLLAIIASVWLGDVTPDYPSLTQQAKRAALEGKPANNLLPDIEARIRSGIQAYKLLEQLRDNDQDPQLQAEFAHHQSDLGYAWLLKRWTQHIGEAKETQIKLAAQAALPAHPWLLYWGYRLMLVCGGISLLLLTLTTWHGWRNKPLPEWLLQLSIYLAPLPWLACIAGWLVAELGKQPWAIAEVLPTFLSVSSLSVKELILSLLGYLLAYAVLLAAGLRLIQQSIHTVSTAEGAKL